MNSRANPSEKSLYSRAANTGAIVGLYLSAIFALWIISEQAPLLWMVSMLMAVLFPVVLYCLMLREDRYFDRRMQLTRLWISGIVMVTCGAIITAAVTVIYLKWFDPDFMLRRLTDLIRFSAENPDPSYAETARLAQGLIDNNAVPSATIWMSTMWLFTVSSGSILAGLLAVIIKSANLVRYRRRT